MSTIIYPGQERSKISIPVEFVLKKFNIKLTEEEVRELKEQAYYEWHKANNIPYIRGTFNY